MATLNLREPLKLALCAIALSPFALSAELPSYEDGDSVTYEEDWDEEEDGLYEDEDNLADSSENSYSQRSNGYNPNGDDYYSRGEDSFCQSPFHRMHVGARHTEARGVGYRDGYTTLEAFGIYDNNPNFMPFLDLRGHVFNNGKLAGNVGIGERTYLSSINHLLGIYLYYDVRQENHNFTINQLSPGVELLGKRMEYRVNGYFPVGGNRSDKYSYAFDRFSGHNILLRHRQKFALTGFDAEVGAHLTQSTKYDLYAGAGPYYFTASHASSWGGKVRLLGRYKEYISLEASYSYDRLYRSVVQGTVGLSYPFGRKLKRRGRDCPQQNDLVLSRAAFAPYRFEIPVVKRVTKRSPAINPATGSPWVVWFVNNTSSSSGTFGSPFPTLLQAQNASAPNDMIYVFPGNGTTMGMDRGITLKDGQTFFGSGVSHEISTTQGTMTIPAFSTTAPTITNTAGTGVVVTLANSNEIAGFNVSVLAGALPAGFRGVGTQNASISSNTIAGTIDYFGIDISQASGDFFIDSNTISGPVSAGLSGRGIVVFLTDFSTATGLTSNNSVTGFNRGITWGPITQAAFSSQIINNQIQSFQEWGIQSINNSSTGSSFIVQGNTVINDFGGNNSIGILDAANTVPLANTRISNNRIITTTAGTGTIGISAPVNAPTATFYRSIITNNAITTGSGANSIGLAVSSVANGVVCTSISGNTISIQGPGTNGISITTTGTGIVNIDNLSDNIAPAINVSGNVNLVLPGSCDQ